MSEKQLKILMIEDDVFIADLYKRELEKNGYLVVCCRDGENGLSTAISDKFDLILLDIMLPKKTGLEVLRELRASKSGQSKTPVFILTNLGQESVIREAFEIGADGYILKARLLPRQIVHEIQDFFRGESFSEERTGSKK